MEHIPILAPAAVLVLWSLVMLLWVTATRFPAFTRAGITVGNAEPGSRYVDVESMLPAKVNWKSHNYTHLMEQPTIFYAAVAVLALAGEGAGINATMAWAYVGLRVVHSVWQSTVNIISVRITLFTLSTLCLWVLAINAVRATLF
ncbi:MAG: MAPEG family protein [Gammaproteobacteria bacterium]|nr:MAPEG family protein [Gammaproteobacteria bacterium]